MTDSKQIQQVDFAQVKTLVRNNIRLDWRGTTNPLSGYGTKKGKFPGIVVIFLMNAVLSAIISAFFVKSADLFTGLVVTTTVAMGAIAMQVMMEFGNTLMSAEDYLIVSPHPVNSKTFFVAKLYHQALYVTALALSISLIPAIFSSIYYKSILVLPLVLGQNWICAIFASVFIMNIYTWVLKKVDRHRLERWMGYIHMVLLLGMYLGLNVLPKMLKNVLTNINIADYWWGKLLPAYWFASLYRLIKSGWDTQYALFGLLGLIVLFILGRIAVSYLSLSYAESLTKTGWNREKIRSNRSPGIFARLWDRYSNDEDKALMRLMRANFKHDIQFRIGVMSLIPLVIFYLAFSLFTKGTNVRDPFLILDNSQVMTNIFFGMACVIGPYTLIGAMQASKQWRAAWVFYSAPVDRVKLVLAMERIANIVIMVPMGLFLFVVLAFVYKQPLHAFLHTLSLIIMALNTLSFINIYSIRLPFAMDSTGNNWASSILAPMLLSVVIFIVPLTIVGVVGYGGYLGWAGFVTFFILLRWVLGKGQKSRIKRAFAKWEFTG